MSTPRLRARSKKVAEEAKTGSVVAVHDSSAAKRDDGNESGTGTLSGDNDEGIVPLDADDSMFKGSRNRVQQTPLILTRRSARYETTSVNCAPSSVPPADEAADTFAPAPSSKKRKGHLTETAVADGDESVGQDGQHTVKTRVRHTASHSDDGLSDYERKHNVAHDKGKKRARYYSPSVVEPGPSSHGVYEYESDTTEAFVAADDKARPTSPVKTSTSGSPAVLPSSPAQDSRVTFGDIITQQQSKASKKVSTVDESETFASALTKLRDANGSDSVFMSDLDTYRVRKLPDVCGVTDPALQDPVLKEGYVGLPNLEPGAFVPWSSMVGPGQISFSSWGVHIPRLRFQYCLRAIGFVQSARHINPSRVSPKVTNTVRTTPNGFRLNLHVGTSPAVCVTCIYTTESYLLKPPSRGVPQKQILGICHSQEWERLVAFFCMTFGHKELNAQLSADSIAFATRAAPRETTSTSKPSMFSTVRSPSIKRSGGTQRGDEFTLAFEDNIPVYDGRNQAVNYDRDLDSLDRLLPKIQGELPYGTFAVVGYTASAYRSNKTAQWYISFNIKWLIVLGIPDSSSSE